MKEETFTELHVCELKFPRQHSFVLVNIASIPPWMRVSLPDLQLFKNLATPLAPTHVQSRRCQFCYHQFTLIRRQPFTHGQQIWHSLAQKIFTLRTVGFSVGRLSVLYLVRLSIGFNCFQVIRRGPVCSIDCIPSICTILMLINLQYAIIRIRSPVVLKLSSS